MALVENTHVEKQNILFEGKHMFKYFGATKAVDDVDISIADGEIHGLIGENGSGKSTVSSLFAAVQKADRGEMFLNGEPYMAESVLDANQRGVSMIVQEQGTFELCNVAANIFAGKEKMFSKRNLINVRKMNIEARKALDSIGLVHINEKAMVGELSFENRKLIELARAVYFNPSLLIIDETSNALTIHSRELMYGVIRKMRESGRSTLFISHDIDEVMMLCDRITVLRDGHLIQTLDKKDFSPDTIRRLMVGREVQSNYYRNDYECTSLPEMALRMENCWATNLEDVSLDLHYGEIVGVGGLADSGMHTIGHLFFGLTEPDLGQVTMDGQLINSPTDAMSRGIAYIPKDRDREALLGTASILDNICLPSYNKLKTGVAIFPGREKKFAEEWAGILDIKMADICQPVMYLSGGNKQKVSVSKWMGFNAKVFIFDCPTRGIDIGVKEKIYQLIIRLKNEGNAILMISEELPELIGMSDRMVILRDGKINAILKRNADLTEHHVIQYMI